MDLKKEITEMIYKNSHDTSEGVLIDFKVITPLIENIVAIAVTHCCTELKCEGCKKPLNSGLCGSCCSDLASGMY